MEDSQFLQQPTRHDVIPSTPPIMETETEMDELLAQIERLEADIKSPIAIGKMVNVRNDEGNIEGGWTVEGYTVDDSEENVKPHASAVVVKYDAKKGRRMQIIAIGGLRVLNQGDEDTTIH